VTRDTRRFSQAGGLAPLPEHRALSFSVVDGHALLGDLYLPRTSSARHSVLILVPGGGWSVSDREGLRPWARLLASSGYGAFCIEYSVKAPPRSAFPGPVNDIFAAARFLQTNAVPFSLDPARIGLLGESAGATLAALAALGRRTAQLSSDREGEHLALSTFVGVYGTYDMAARWHHQLLANEPPGQGLCHRFLGAELYENQQLYFDASPLKQVTHANCRNLEVFLAWGEADRLVPPAEQSEPFVRALRLAGANVTTCPVPNAEHFWFQSQSYEDPATASAYLAPHLLGFLAQSAMNTSTSQEPQ
jgi:acetyl esterase/lipase